MSHTRNLRDSTITFVDGTTPTALTLLVELENGDMSFTETNNVNTIMNRGKIDHRRKGDEQEMELSFTAKFVQWSFNDGAATGISIPDVLFGRGGASTWVSTDEACAPFALDVEFRIKNPCVEGDIEVLTFPKCVVTSIQFSEADEFNTLNLTLRSLATTPTRTYETA